MSRGKRTRSTTASDASKRRSKTKRIERTADAEASDSPSQDEKERPGYLVEGDDSEFVILETGDLHTFVVRRSLACTSPTLKSMLNSPPCIQGNRNLIILEHIPGSVLRRAIQYMLYRERFERVRRTSAEPFPEFTLESNEALPVLMAATFLQI